MKIQRILVPTDFSAFSLRALNDAVDLGKPVKARIIVLHALEPVYFAAAADLYGPGMNLRMLLEEQRRAAEKRLARLASAREKKRVPLETVLVNAPAATAILDVAKKRRVDVIVMSTHGRGGLSRLVLGSVAEKVVRAAHCPVLTVRAAAGARAGGKKTRRKRT